MIHYYITQYQYHIFILVTTAGNSQRNNLDNKFTDYGIETNRNRQRKDKIHEVIKKNSRQRIFQNDKNQYITFDDQERTRVHSLNLNSTANHQKIDNLQNIKETLISASKLQNRFKELRVQPVLSPNFRKNDATKFAMSTVSPMNLEKRLVMGEISPNRNIKALVSPRNISSAAMHSNKILFPTAKQIYNKENTMSINQLDAEILKLSQQKKVESKLFEMNSTQLSNKKSPHSARINLIEDKTLSISSSLTEIDNLYLNLRTSLGSMGNELHENEQFKQLLVNLKVFMNGTQTLLCEFQK